jgi:hypothetical protein
MLPIRPKGMRIRATHDVPALWRDAGLPQFSNEDQRILVRAKWLLQWRSRYAAPNSDKQIMQEQSDHGELGPGILGGLLADKPRIDWDNFERLHQLALKDLRDIGE